MSRRLIHFELRDRGIARHGYDICTESGELIGHVTSGIMLPMTRVSIGMGYVRSEYCVKGCSIWVRVRDKLLRAEVV